MILTNKRSHNGNKGRSNSGHTYSRLFGNHIDDCFITWKTNENLDVFEEILNNLHPSIKFTKDTDDDKSPFLDLLVIKTAEGKIETDIFYKKTNAHRYLCFESAHPRKMKRNTSFTLAKRITRIASNPDRREQRFKGKLRSKKV